MTNIDHAAEVLADWVLPGVPPEVVAQALAKAGLLAPEPQIIRARDELAALDPSTTVTNGPLIHVAATAVPFHEIGLFTLPAVVLATGDEVRAARQALEDTDAVD